MIIAYRFSQNTYPRSLQCLVVKNRDWSVDFQSGTLSFGRDSYPVQFIGSESTASDTWKWDGITSTA